MIAFAHRQTILTRLLQPAALKRALIAGAAWRAMLTITLTALAAWQCGNVYVDDAMWLGGVSTATGIFAIGPIAALGRSAKG